MNRLKVLREEKALFQKDIAEYLNCSIAIISMYEKEQRIMDVNIAQKLSNFFNVSVDYLLGKSDIRNPEKEKQIKQDILNLAQIGFSKDNYNPPTEKQKEDIRAFLEVFLRDNKKNKEN